MRISDWSSDVCSSDLQKPDAEKISAYECGFDPYEDARNSFDIRFYLVAILFIIFDLEAMFFFPWSVTLGANQSIAFWGMIDFLLELIIGFIYAWLIGALERSEEHTSELQSLMRISYAVFCLKKKIKKQKT